MFVVVSCVSEWVGLDVRRAKGVFKKVDENHKDRLTSELGSTERRGRTDRESRIWCTDGRYREKETSSR
jgi:hypothetical protein